MLLELINGQADQELGVFTLLALHSDTASMVLDDLSAEVKAHTGRLARGLRRKEGGKNLILDLLVNTGSVIPDSDIQVIAIHLQS